VLGEYRVATKALGVDHLRLILGTSMGCMHSWVWGGTYPDCSDALMPLASMPVPITGRNRMTRKKALDAIIDDPVWMQGEYKTQPRQLKTSIDMLIIMGSSPLQMQKLYPCPPWLIGSFVINTLPLKTQVKHRVTPSSPRHYPLKFEITLCVKGVVSPILANTFLHYAFDL
jgi:homoserine acetyltransferase